MTVSEKIHDARRSLLAMNMKPNAIYLGFDEFSEFLLETEGQRAAYSRELAIFPGVSPLKFAGCDVYEVIVPHHFGMSLEAGS